MIWKHLEQEPWGFMMGQLDCEALQKVFILA